MGANKNRFVRFDGSHCFLLEGVQLEWVFLGLCLASVLVAFIASGVVDLVNAPFLLSNGFDGNVFQPLGGIFMLAVSVIFRHFDWWLVEVLSLGGLRLSSYWYGSLRGVENIKRVVLLHC